MFVQVECYLILELRIWSVSFTLNNIHIDYEQDNKLHVKHWKNKAKKKNTKKRTKKPKKKQTKNPKNNQTDIKRKDLWAREILWSLGTT